MQDKDELRKQKLTREAMGIAEGAGEEARQAPNTRAFELPQKNSQARIS